MEQTTDIFARLEVKRIEQRESDTADYWHLLATTDTSNPTAADQKKLASLLQSLEKTPADAMADHQTILKAKTDIRFIRDNADAQRHADDAVQAKQNALLERQQLWQAMNAKITEATETESARLAIRDRWQQKRQELATLEADHPIIFATVTANVTK